MKRLALTLTACALSLALIAGCGGGGPVSPGSTGSTGSATFTVLWPERAEGRLIPVACNSIKVEIRDGGNVLASQTVDRPEGGGPASVVFQNLPVGTWAAVAKAYPQAGAAGTVQAEGSVPLTIRDGQETAFTLTMATTVATLEVTPVAPSVIVNETVQLIATAKDANGNVVLVAPAAIGWVSANAAVATVAADGKVTGLTLGNADVTATDSESGKTAKTTVTVTSLPVVYVDQSAPGPSHDGKSWQTAFLTVQEGLNAANRWDAVWVAAATYTERITLKAQVGLYGGFAGMETAFEQRDPAKNITILDGNQGGSVVTVPNEATATTVIDGFTIRNGEHGGINCQLGAPTIANNTITGNTAFDGGGIFAFGAATISNNTITGNTATGGEGGGGIYALVAATISNNTITGNTASRGGGISVQGAATIRKIVPQAITIFLTAESEDELIARLRRRHTEKKAQLQQRIETARAELRRAGEFDYRVENRECALESTVDTVLAIMQAEKCRIAWQPVTL